MFENLHQHYNGNYIMFKFISKFIRKITESRFIRKMFFTKLLKKQSSSLIGQITSWPKDIYYKTIAIMAGSKLGQMTQQNEGYDPTITPLIFAYFAPYSIGILRDIFLFIRSKYNLSDDSRQDLNWKEKTMLALRSTQSFDINKCFPCKVSLKTCCFSISKFSTFYRATKNIDFLLSLMTCATTYSQELWSDDDKMSKLALLVGTIAGFGMIAAAYLGGEYFAIYTLYRDYTKAKNDATVWHMYQEKYGYNRLSYAACLELDRLAVNINSEEDSEENFDHIKSQMEYFTNFSRTCRTFYTSILDETSSTGISLHKVYLPKECIFEILSYLISEEMIGHYKKYCTTPKHIEKIKTLLENNDDSNEKSSASTMFFDTQNSNTPSDGIEIIEKISPNNSSDEETNSADEEITPLIQHK